MLKVLVILILVAIAAGAAFVGIYTNQPDLTFRTFGKEIVYPTSQGNLYVLFDSNGRIVYRALSDESLESGSSGQSSSTVRWETDGDKKIKWIETATTRRKVIFNENGIQIFDKTWPKVQGSDTGSGNTVANSGTGSDGTQSGDGTASVTTDNTGSTDSGTGNSATTSSKYAAGFDPFAPENMMLIKSHPQGDKIIEWYETLERDFKVKVIRMNGHVIYKKKFPVQRRETPPATPSTSVGTETGTAVVEAPIVTKAPVPTVAPTKPVPTPKPTKKPVKPVNPNLQLKPSGQTFKLISRSASGRGRKKKYVLWYESADWKRKVIKQSGKVVKAFNYPKTPPKPTKAPVPTVAPVVTKAPVPTVAPVVTKAPVPTVVPVATEVSVPTVVPVATKTATTGTVSIDPSLGITPTTTGVPLPTIVPELVKPVIPKMSVQWTETATASFKTLVDVNGRVIFRQRIPK